MKQNISLFKYIGEKARSTYERVWEHLNDKEQLKLNSHMLKHVIAEHEGEALENVEFGMRAVQFTRSSFERQILEACKIQENRVKHTLLNSKSEYNRSAIPRIVTQLGEREDKKSRKEKEEEKKREDILEDKIKRMRKERNCERKVTQPNEMNKRRKINETEFEETKTAWGRPNPPEIGKKRKEE